MKHCNVKKYNSILYFILFTLLLSGTYVAHISLTPPLFIPGTNSSSPVDPSKPRVLVVILTDVVGGGETHSLGLYSMLTKHGYNASLLVERKSKFDQYLTERGIPHYTIRAHRFRFAFLRPLYHLVLKNSLRTICKKEKISIINCNCTPDVQDALSMKKDFPVHVVYTCHNTRLPSNEHVRNADVVAPVTKEITTQLYNKNVNEHLNIGKIVHIPPLFDPSPFSSYSSIETSETFYKNNFGITIKNQPIIVMIANFYHNLLHKNHPLLFDAIKILVQKNKPVQVMLAGTGPRKEYLENLAKELGIEQNVKFLGFTNNVASLLAHADIMVLSSSDEASPIVYREAGLMKKPAIGATKTGAEAIIIHEKTGLLFKNSDAQDLADQIERIIDNPEWAKELGVSAYEHIKNNFSPEVIFAQYDKIYQELKALDQR